MRYIERMILERGKVLDGGIVKVDSFVNHQVDPGVLDKAAEEFFAEFKDSKIEKILTCEVSGIAVAYPLAKLLGVKLVYAKKTTSKTIRDNFFKAEVESFTHKTTYNFILAEEFLTEGENVLIVDDFLAKGYAVLGLREIISQAKANLVGVAILIEKCYLGAGEKLKKEGIHLCSLAKIKSINKEIIFED